MLFIFTCYPSQLQWFLFTNTIPFSISTHQSHYSNHNICIFLSFVFQKKNCLFDWLSPKCDYHASYNYCVRILINIYCKLALSISFPIFTPFMEIASLLLVLCAMLVKSLCAMGNVQLLILRVLPILEYERFSGAHLKFGWCT
jgi:hypothetical protein